MTMPGAPLCEIANEAYIYFFPLVMMNMIRKVMTKSESDETRLSQRLDKTVKLLDERVIHPRVPESHASRDSGNIGNNLHLGR
jgi:hypothetical protein